MRFAITQPSSLFLGVNGGATLNPQIRCDHDTPSVSFHLVGKSSTGPDDVEVVMPSCLAAGLFGATLAHIEAHGGQEAVDRFLADMNTAREQATSLLPSYQAATEDLGSACCETGFLTQGRKHTCRPDTTG
ncbi:hypothetical protein [Streptomyces sp. NPDC048242]|uniref:hypothetical protein n=1 Tax=Streptomyces sp. NPDC048242 TaxID=3155026 RepID=UPI003430CD86